MHSGDSGKKVGDGNPTGDFNITTSRWNLKMGLILGLVYKMVLPDGMDYFPFCPLVL
jgi:hypothetical protein